jgi:hypothetical protein
MIDQPWWPILSSKKRFSAMKILNQRAYKFGLILVTSIFIAACVSEPAIVDLSTNHPANPRSPETAFIPPPNPFQNNNQRVGQEVENNSSMTHDKNQPAHQHQMSHGTGHDSTPSQGREEHNPQHQHKEHY